MAFQPDKHSSFCVKYSFDICDCELTCKFFKYTITLRFLLYLLVLLYVLFELFWLIFTYTYRTISKIRSVTFISIVLIIET